MRAVIYERYGAPEVLQLRDIPKPTPKKDEILIKIYATSVTAADWRLRKPDPFLARLFNGLFRPSRIKVLGFEVAGVVEEVGSDVTLYQKGEAVFASCGLKFGGYAEYCCLKENGLIALKPAHFSFEEAATTSLGACTALILLRKGGIAQGQQVLIYGASGSVGTFAIQLARYFGATVTAVCSTANIELVKSLGAEHAIDYTQEDFTASSARYDLVFDAVGKAKKAACKKILKPKGKFVSSWHTTNPKKEDIDFLRELMEKRALLPVIDRVYTLEQMQEAHRYVEQFRKKGNVAVRVAEN